MKAEHNKDNILVPPPDIILALLNNHSGNDFDLLEFYNGYIHAAAIEPVYIEGNKVGYFTNEDLIQEIRIEFLKSLSSLRKKLMCGHPQEESELSTL